MTIKLLSLLPLALSALTFGQSCLAHESLHAASLQSDAPKCVLSTASSGQTVTVRGKVRNTAHDMAFDVPDCEEDRVADVRWREGQRCKRV